MHAGAPTYAVATLNNGVGERHAKVVKHFPTALTANDFITRVESQLLNLGFTGDNAIGEWGTAADMRLGRARRARTRRHGDGGAAGRMRMAPPWRLHRHEWLPPPLCIPTCCQPPGTCTCTARHCFGPLHPTCTAQPHLTSPACWRPLSCCSRDQPVPR